MKSVIIIGGGISGLFSAYYLSQLDYDITIIDSGDLTNGCSFGNAGLIVPSHIIPLASPGIIHKALKWMFNSHSPFSFHPKLNKDFILWCLSFFLKSSKSHIERSIKPLREISYLSSDLYKELDVKFDNSFSLKSNGLLMLYKNEKTAEEEMKLAKLAVEYGIETNILTPKNIELLEPNCKYNTIGGVHYLSDSHLIPNLLMQNLINYLKVNNVCFIPGEKITDINYKNRKIISVTSNKKNYEGDLFLFTSGVWSSELLKKINLNIPLVAGRGYSFNIPVKNNSPTIPSILVDDRVAVTPMGKKLRIAGTMEIDSVNSKIRTNRIKGMVQSFNKYFPELNVELPGKDQIWYGHRPCSPDGLPYIGKSDYYNNLFVAAGHAMLGVSLGPATGMLISELISGAKPSLDLSPFNVDRYAKFPITNG